MSRPPAEPKRGSLSELTSAFRRLALVGLAKNTGKTVALATLLRELEAAGRTVGVTSVGRDGEEHDVIDFQIEKPRIELAAGSLVATTDELLRASAIPHDLLEQTEVRTPLGRVLIARIRNAGTIEVAGPSGAEQVRAVADTMLSHGAEQVLIDGAIDRRAASSPEVADGLLISTGAVLDREIEEVVLQTADAVELVRLPMAAQAPAALPLPPRFPLTAEAEEIARLLDANPEAERLLVAGALPDRFLRALVHVVHRRRREIAVIVADPTRVFLAKRGPRWYAHQGVHLQVRSPISLAAITVNPLAPRSHHFDSKRLRSLLEAAIDDVPIFDVLHPDYERGDAFFAP